MSDKSKTLDDPAMSGSELLRPSCSRPVRVKLHDRLKAAGFDVDEPYRLFPHWEQRYCGSWGWCAKLRRHIGFVGSQESMTDMLKYSDEDFKKCVDVN